MQWDSIRSNLRTYGLKYYIETSVKKTPPRYLQRFCIQFCFKVRLLKLSKCVTYPKQRRHIVVIWLVVVVPLVTKSVTSSLMPKQLKLSKCVTYTKQRKHLSYPPSNMVVIWLVVVVPLVTKSVTSS